MTLRFLNLSKSNPNFLVACRRTCLYVCVACARALVCARRTLHAEMSSSKYEHCSVNHSKMDRLHLMYKHHIKGAGQARTDIDKPCKDPSIQQSGQELLHNTLTKTPHWARTQMKHLPTCWIIWRHHQHIRSESSKEGTAHNIQRVQQSPSCRNIKGHRGLRSTNTAKVKTVLPFRKSATLAIL